MDSSSFGEGLAAAFWTVVLLAFGAGAIIAVTVCKVVPWLFSHVKIT